MDSEVHLEFTFSHNLGQPETKVGDLCQELGITRQTLYRHISPTGELRPDGSKLLAKQ